MPRSAMELLASSVKNALRMSRFRSVHVCQGDTQMKWTSSRVTRTGQSSTPAPPVAAWSNSSDRPLDAFRYTAALRSQNAARQARVLALRSRLHD